MSTRWLFTILLLVGGLLYLALTPPYQSNDEPTHMVRIIQLSGGELKGRIQNDGLGCDIPAAVHDDLRIGHWLVMRPNVGTSLGDLNAHWRASEPWTAEGMKKDLEFAPCQFQHYPPVAHLPQTMGAVVARLFEWNTLTAMYVARLGNLLGFCAAMFAVFTLLRESPRMQLLMFMLAGVPTVLFLSATLSADTPTTAMAFVVFALAMHLRSGWTERGFVLLLISAAMLALCKNVYFLVPLLAVPTIWALPETRKRRLLRTGLLAAAAIVPLALWMLYIRDFTGTRAMTHFSADPADKMREVLSGPFSVLWGWVQYLIGDFRYLRLRFTATMGWGEVSFPTTLLEAYFIGLFVVAAVGAGKSQERRFDPWLTAWRIALFFTVALMIYMALFVMSGREKIIHTQARYYAPIAPLLLTSVPILLKLGERSFAWWRRAVVVAWLATTCTMGGILWQRFWSDELVSARIAEMHDRLEGKDLKRSEFRRRGDGNWVLVADAPSVHGIMRLPSERFISIEYGVQPTAPGVASDPVQFSIEAELTSGRTVKVWSDEVSPKTVPVDRRPQSCEVFLPTGIRTLLFKTSQEPGAAGGLAYWRRVDFVQ